MPISWSLFWKLRGKYLKPSLQLKSIKDKITKRVLTSLELLEYFWINTDHVIIEIMFERTEVEN